MSVEITAFHVSCLQQFVDKRALTETGLARLAKCEKAVAKYAIGVLMKAGFLKRLGAYEYTLTSDGELYLKGKNSGVSSSVIVQKPTTAAKPVKDVTLEELEVLNLPPSDPVGNQKLADTLADQVDKIILAPTEEVMAEVIGERIAPTLPAPEQADFQTLVRQGLARLNKQLGVKLVTIEKADLKVEALTNLSKTLAGFDTALSVLLADVARDIQRVDNRSS